MSGTLIFVLVLVAALIITLYMVYKNGGSSPAPAPASAPAPSGPSIDVQGIERTLNPDKSDNGSSSTSGYAIREYSTGTDNFDYNKLTENVEITLKWDNQGGFDSVTGLIAEWQIKGEGDNDYVTRMTKTLNKTDYPDAFANYTRGNTVTFTGNKDLADDKRFSAVGENIIHLYYNTTEVTKQQITPDVDAINYTPWVIGVSDLSATIDMVDPKTYTYVPIKSDVSLGRDQIHTDYKIYSKLFKDDISKLIISNKIHENNYRLQNPPGYIRLTPVVVNGTVQKDKIKLVYVSEDGTVKKGVGVAGKTPGIEKVIHPLLTNSDFYDDASEKYATDQPYIGVTDNIDDSYIFNIVPVYESGGNTIEYYRFQDSVETDRFMCLRKVVYDKNGHAEFIEGVDRYATVQVCLKNANELSFCEKESMDFTLVDTSKENWSPPPFTSAAESMTGIENPPAGECEVYAPSNVNYNWRCQNRIVISPVGGNKERHREVVPIHNGDEVSNRVCCDDGVDMGTAPNTHDGHYGCKVSN